MAARIASLAGSALVLGGGFLGPGAGAAQPVASVPARATCLPFYGTFRAGNWPSGCWRPYADASPFNQPIGARPRALPNSGRIVRRLLRWGRPDNLVAGAADTREDYDHPTYYSEPTDPRFRLHCYERSRRPCAIEGMLIRIPDRARPAAGGDAHLTVVDQVEGWEYDLYKVRRKRRGGGRLEFRWGGRTRIDGHGLASDATAARFGNLAGIIRAPELEAGRIDHALFMVARCDSGRFVYPAFKTGRPCAELGASNRDAPPMGARVQLVMSDAEIESLAVPAWRKTIFRAMARYGMYMGDTGDGAWGIETESGSTYTSFGYQDRLVTFARAAGVPRRGAFYVFNIRSGVNWARRLRVVDPCETLRTC